MANDPKVLEVGYRTTTEKVSGGQGTSSATVSSAPKELLKSQDAQVGENLTNVKGVAIGNTEERSLKVSRDVKGGSYVRDTNQVSDPGRIKRNVVNTVTVEDVKALIKKYGGSDGYSKEQIDEMLATIREGQYVEVNTTEYPTLEDFLASEGEQGTVYLYPVGNEENNYYQYIWEVDEWVSLGTTVLDLDNYGPLDANNTWTGKNTFTKPVDASNVFNVIDSLTSTTLTADEIAIITNGKPTIIVSNSSSLSIGSNAILMPPKLSGSIYRGLIVYSGPSTPIIGTYSIENSVLNLYATGTNNGVTLRSLYAVNGKSIPAYPSNTGTWVMKCIDGVLTWVQES